MDKSHNIDGAPAAEHPIDDQSRPPSARTAWSVLKALFESEIGADSLARMLQALCSVLPFDQAIVLQVRDGSLVCVAALPPAPSDLRLPTGEFLQTVLLGRVCVLNPDHDRSDLPADLIPPTHAALLLPIGLKDERAVLLLSRANGASGFSVDDVDFARQCAVVSLAALIVQVGAPRAAEIERLNALLAQSRQSEDHAQQDNRLLKEIVNHLPIALTVQDAEGRFILVNDIAATNLGTPADSLIGASPANFLAADDAASRRDWELALLKDGRTSTVEESVAGKAGEQTWLTSHKPVRILDQKLLLTSSLDITERKHIEMDLAKRAHFDELTGFPNRALIEKHVEQTLGRNDKSERFALAFIDLDNFKHINDYYSHAIGDALLVKITRRIANRLRDNDMLARISGDEFLLLLDPVTSETEIRTIVDGILDDLKQPFQIETFEVFTSASIGVSIHPEHGSTYEELRRNADNAMYRAKADTKGNAIYFDINMGQSITARMESEQRLRLAIRDRRFCCAFQPKVDIRNQEVIGFETLVRWRDDDGEIQPPSSFIGLAIELGLIDPITQFVTAEALKSIDCLDDAFGPDTTISINIAAKQASDVNFMRSLAESLHASNRAERIMLELTEDAFVAKNQFQTQILPMLREIGVRVSIDDFGTGYSSLSTLADITADEIKVDRSFISAIQQRPRNQSVLRAIESLSYALGMTIVAEGVETFEELAYLQAATRIRYAQGYYFSKPFFLEDAATAKNMTFDGRPAEAAREQSDRRRSHSTRTVTNARTDTV
jgi:diguanylate cyclase (GGDEF)-like protein/PAS domain S-box-containing protein